MSVNIGGGEGAHPFRAQQIIPCLVGECPGHMALVIFRQDGTLLERPFNDGPYYRCTRVGCHYHDHPRGLHEINTAWITDAHRPGKRTEIKEAEK